MHIFLLCSVVARKHCRAFVLDRRERTARAKRKNAMQDSRKTNSPDISCGAALRHNRSAFPALSWNPYRICMSARLWCSHTLSCTTNDSVMPAYQMCSPLLLSCCFLCRLRCCFVVLAANMLHIVQKCLRFCASLNSNGIWKFSSSFWLCVDACLKKTAAIVVDIFYILPQCCCWWCLIVVVFVLICSILAACTELAAIVCNGNHRNNKTRWFTSEIAVVVFLVPIPTTCLLPYRRYIRINWKFIIFIAYI